MQWTIVIIWTIFFKAFEDSWIIVGLNSNLVPVSWFCYFLVPWRDTTRQFVTVLKRMTTNSLWLKVFLQIALLVIFLVFFGFPSIGKYQKKETITVSSEKFTNGIEPPALTILGIQNSGLGWKTPQDGLDTWNSFKFDEHCAKLKTTTIEKCVENDTFHSTDVVKSAQYVLSNNINSTNSSAWT